MLTYVKVASVYYAPFDHLKSLSILTLRAVRSCFRFLHSVLLIPSVAVLLLTSSIAAYYALTQRYVEK